MVTAFDVMCAAAGSARRFVMSPAAPPTTLILSLTTGSLPLPSNAPLEG
jgi:hypothetical protein